MRLTLEMGCGGCQVATVRLRGLERFEQLVMYTFSHYRLRHDSARIAEALNEAGYAHGVIYTSDIIK